MEYSVAPEIKELPGPWFNIKMSSHQYRKSHCGDKMVIRSSYLHNGISYIGKMWSLCWIGPQSFGKGQHETWELNQPIVKLLYKHVDVQWFDYLFLW